MDVLVNEPYRGMPWLGWAGLDTDSGSAKG